MKIIFLVPMVTLLLVPLIQANALTDYGLDKKLMQLDDWQKVGIITSQEETNAINYYHSKHLVTEDQFKNTIMRVMVYSQTGKYDPTFLRPVTTNIFNSTIMKCTIYVDGTSADVLGTIKNRDISPHTVIVTYQALDSNNQVLKSVDSDRHQIQGLSEWFVEQTIAGSMNIDHCGLSVQVLK